MLIYLLVIIIIVLFSFIIKTAKIIGGLQFLVKVFKSMQWKGGQNELIAFRGILLDTFISDSRPQLILSIYDVLPRHLPQCGSSKRQPCAELTLMVVAVTLPPCNAQF